MPYGVSKGSQPSRSTRRKPIVHLSQKSKSTECDQPQTWKSDYLFDVMVLPFPQQYLAFQEDLRLRCDVYERFRIKGESKTLLVITEDKWTYLQQRWSYVSQQTRVWQWKLDSNLPGRLGQMGDWLYRAEEMVQTEINYADKHEDTVENIQTKLEDIGVSSSVLFFF